MSKQKIGIIVGGLCLLALAAVFIVKQQYESKVQKNIEAFLASLPQSWNVKAEKIDVSFFDKSVILTNLKGSYTLTLPQGGTQESLPMAFAFDRIKATGVNLDGFEPGAGTVTLLDSLDFTNMTFTSPLAQASVESYSIQGISGDFQLVADEIVKAAPTIMAANAVSDYPASGEELNKMMGAFAGIFKAYETVSFKRISLRNYKYALDFQGQKIDMSLGATDGKDYSIRRMGSCTLTDARASLNGVPIFSMESGSIDELVLPSFVSMFEILAKSDSPSPDELMASLKNQPFALKNMRFKNMTMQNPLEPDKTVFSLADISLSYVIEDSHAVDFSFNSLAIDKGMLAAGNGLPDSALSPLPDPVTLEGALALNVKQQGGGLCDLNVKKLFLKGPGLGEANMAFAAENVNTMIAMRGISDMAAILKNFDLSVTDDGLSDVIFATEGGLRGSSAEEVRTQHMESLKKELADEDTAVGKEVLTALINFLTKPGATLGVTVAPPAPTPLAEQMEAFANDDAASIGFSVTFTPGK